MILKVLFVVSVVVGFCLFSTLLQNNTTIKYSSAYKDNLSFSLNLLIDTDSQVDKDYNLEG